ncbi:lipoprotein [Methylopila henanensis]|uniref:Lipoprotein n=1 Tax=Methylopila henanensis TaxID=873516 RepID=A0ABW4K6C0_9HYPH
MPSPIRAAAIAATLVLAVGLSACGRRGPLEPPPGAPTTTVTKSDGTTEKKVVKPNRPFVLDGLLN